MAITCLLLDPQMVHVVSLFEFLEFDKVESISLIKESQLASNTIPLHRLEKGSRIIHEIHLSLFNK